MVCTGTFPVSHRSPDTSPMLSPPLSEPKKIPQQLVLHLQTPDFILLFLLHRHVSLWRSSLAAGHDSRFHFPHSPVIPFDPSLYYIFILKTKILRNFTICFPCCSSPAFLFLLVYGLAIQKAPCRSYFPTPGGLFVNVRFSWFCALVLSGFIAGTLLLCRTLLNPKRDRKAC